jgi:hypothetical protein
MLRNSRAQQARPSPVPKAVIVACGPAKCEHQFFQAFRRSVEALASIHVFDFDDAAATLT